MSNAVAIADAFVQRPASACCWSETTLATATRWISAFRVRIPRTSHGGLTPPALGAVRTFVGEKTICAMHERAFPGAAGVSPPWRVIQWAIATIEHCSPTRERTSKSGGRQPAVGMSNAVATVSVHRPPTGGLCATIAVLPLQTRFSNHGWLTPVAPGCPRADCCRKAVAIDNGVLFPTGGLRPPLLVQGEHLSAKKRFVRCTNAHSQERRASARRGYE